MAETITIYVPTKNGHVMTHGYSSDLLDRRPQQAYVNRNNAAAHRRGDSSKPYALRVYTFTAQEG